MLPATVLAVLFIVAFGGRYACILIARNRFVQAASMIEDDVYEAFVRATDLVRGRYPNVPLPVADVDALVGVISEDHNISWWDIFKSAAAVRSELISRSTAKVLELHVLEYLQLWWIPQVFDRNARVVPKDFLEQFWPEVVDRGGMGKSSIANPMDWDLRKCVVMKRDELLCQRCGLKLQPATGHVHHMVKRSEGGSHALDNLVLLCEDCHYLMPGHPYCKWARDIVPPKAFYRLQIAVDVANAVDESKRRLHIGLCRPWSCPSRLRKMLELGPSTSRRPTKKPVKRAEEAPADVTFGTLFERAWSLRIEKSRAIQKLSRERIQSEEAFSREAVVAGFGRIRSLIHTGLQPGELFRMANLGEVFDEDQWHQFYMLWQTYISDPNTKIE